MRRVAGLIGLAFVAACGGGGDDGGGDDTTGAGGAVETVETTATTAAAAAGIDGADPHLCELFTGAEVSALSGVEVAVTAEEWFPDEGGQGFADAFCTYRFGDDENFSVATIELRRLPGEAEAVEDLGRRGQNTSDLGPLPGIEGAVTWDEGTQAALRVGTSVVTVTWGNTVQQRVRAGIVAAPPPVDQFLSQVIDALTPVLGGPG